MTIYNTANKVLIELFQAILIDLDSAGSRSRVGRNGVIFDAGTYYAKSIVEEYVNENVLNDDKLGKSLFPSWEWLKSCTDWEYYVHQIMHYISTYGVDFSGPVYIPKDYMKTSLASDATFFYVRGITLEEATKRLLGMLQSGMALESDTVKKIVLALDNLGHTITAEDGIINKEAVVYLIDAGVLLPQSAGELFRFLIFKASEGDTSLLIKNHKTIELLKNMSYKPLERLLAKMDKEVLAEEFNRYKPLFLALKAHGETVSRFVNKLSKLSKTHHKPMVQNPINLLTQQLLREEDAHWLENATIYALFKAFRALKMRLLTKEKTVPMIYRIRNGKSYMKDVTISKDVKKICKKNLKAVIGELKKRLSHLEGKTILVDKYVSLGLPTSEKSFIGEIPEYTTWKLPQDNVAIGIYWHNDWGTSDYDLSLVSRNSKVGWNASRQDGDFVYYSGDVTDARNGAVEFLLFKGDPKQEAALFNVNQYSGVPDSKFQVMLGVDVPVEDQSTMRSHMMKTENLLFSAVCPQVVKQTVGGLYFEENGLKCFSLVNMSRGSATVSAPGKNVGDSIEALKLNVISSLGFEGICADIGTKVVTKVKKKNADKVDYDLRIDQLTKDSFVKLLTAK